MAVAWGDFESMALHYLKVLAAEDGYIPIFFSLVVEGTYGVASPDHYREIRSQEEPGNVRPISAMDRNEFIGLMVARHTDFFREAEHADVKESVQAGDEPGGESAVLDARAGRERPGEDAGGGSEAGEAHQALPESAEASE